MYIHSLLLKNFSSYRDEQIVEFSHDKKKKVTIIEGQMGHGKSNLLNAFYWCFFNKYWHSDQARFIDEPDPIKYHLINKGALNDNKVENGEIEVRVEVEFGVDDGSLLKAERTLYAYHLNNSWEYNSSTEFKLGVKSGRTGEYESLVGDEAFGRFQNYFSIELCNYFLFRGENRDELVKLTGKSLFEEAIKKLSKLKLFENLVKHLEYAQTESQKELAKELGGDFEEEINTLHSRIEQSDVMIEALSLKKTELEDVYHKDEAEYFKHRDEIQKNAAAYKLQNEIIRYEEKIKSYENQINGIKTERNQKLVKYWPVLFVYSDVKEVWEKYKKGLKNNIYPPDIKLSMLEKLLEEATCICGTHLNPASKEFEKIQSLLKKGVNDELVTDVTKLANRIEDNLSRFNEYPKQIKDYDQRIIGINQQISKYNDQINGIKPKIGKISGDIKDLQEKQDRANDRKEKTKDKIRDITLRIIDSEDEKKSYKRKLAELEKMNSKSELPSLRAEIARESLDAAIHLQQEYEQNIYNDLEHYTQENWGTLCYDILNYETVKLDQTSKYFDVLDSTGLSRRISMNTGHRLLLTISFISALMKIAKEVWEESFPIIMDAPLSEVGDSAMPQAVEGLTKIFNQSILILQDGSITNKIFSEISGVVGKRYQITYNKAQQHSSIRELD